jgi:thiol-disulfide isomerase/thioredoxin
MSRYIIIPLILVILWPFYKVFLPDGVRSFGFINTISAIVYPYEEIIYENIPELNKDRFNNSIVQADLKTLKATIGKLRGNNNGVNLIVYLYESNCFKCRSLLSTINDIAEEKKNSVKFLVVAFTGDKPAMNNLLNNFESLHFKPIMTEKSNYENFRRYISSDNAESNEMPNIFVYNTQSSSVQSIVPTMFIKNNIMRIIK